MDVRSTEMDLIRFAWFRLLFPRVFNEFYWDRLGFTGCYWVLLDVNGLCWPEGNGSPSFSKEPSALESPGIADRQPSTGGDFRRSSRFFKWFLVPGLAAYWIRLAQVLLGFTGFHCWSAVVQAKMDQLQIFFEKKTGFLHSVLKALVLIGLGSQFQCFFSGHF